MKTFRTRENFNNVLSKDFQRMLFPLNIWQTVFLQPKYWIIRGWIFPNSTVSLGLHVLGVSFMIFVNIARIVVFLTSAFKKLIADVIIWESIFYIAYSMAMFIMNLAHKDRIVVLILQMQRGFEMFKCREFVRDCRRSTLIYISTDLITVVCYLAGQYVISLWAVTYIAFKLSLLYFDANIIFVVQMVQTLAQGLELWRVELEGFVDTCEETDHTQLRKYLTNVSQQKQRLFRSYSDILGAYKLCEKVFYPSIIVLAVRIFIQSLVYVQVFINISKTQGNFYLLEWQILLAVFMISFLAVKNLALLVSTCMAYQRFELGVAAVDAGCAVLRSNHDCLVEVRRLCKNVSRQNAHARGGGAYGALSVDAALPLRLLMLLATYTVVLLQFAFL